MKGWERNPATSFGGAAPVHRIEIDTCFADLRLGSFRRYERLLLRFPAPLGLDRGWSETTVPAASTGLPGISDKGFHKGFLPGQFADGTRRPPVPLPSSKKEWATCQLWWKCAGLAVSNFILG